MADVAMQLAPALDRERYRAEFAEHGRVRVEPFLSDSAATALLEHLLGRGDWREIINSGDKVFELDRATQAKLEEAQRRRLEDAINAGARSGFQHRYESIRIADEAPRRAESATMLDAFAQFLSAPATLQVLQTITGLDDIDFADAQATNYRRGDFLTAHDDEVAGKNRRAAYVFGLTPAWRTEWGGLLLFHDASGDVTQGLAPRFNCLNIFAVPQLHSVSQVASYAAAGRLSVTGWLRAISPPPTGI